jgi:hypothetical protein
MHAADKIDEKIATYDDWRGVRLKGLRQLINDAGAELNEEFKWNTAVWTYNGLVCAISAFKDHVKINFFKGAYLPDPKKLINSGLDSKEHRSINFSETDALDKPAIKQLILEAVEYNKKRG